MRRTSVAFPAAVLVVSGCVHHTLPARDQNALAQAFQWMVNAAPPAKRYTFAINGGQLTKTIARELERSSGMIRRGPEFRPKKPEATAVSFVSIRADPPTWNTPDEADLTISYQVEGDKRVHCAVRLNGQPAGLTSWAIKGSSDAECIARPSATPPPR